MSNELNTSEHDKLRKISDKSQAIGEFVEWLYYQKHWIIAEYDRGLDGYQPVWPDIQALLAEFFGVDYAALMAEKQAIVDMVREARSQRE